MRISFLWDMTQGQWEVVLDILPHEVQATNVTRNVGFGLLIDPAS